LRLIRNPSFGNAAWFGVNFLTCKAWPEFGGEGPGLGAGESGGGGEGGGEGPPEPSGPPEPPPGCTSVAGGCEPPVENPCCFAAGTPVHTKQGTVPIERIQIGDEVLARNRTTGKLEFKPVTALTRPHLDKLLELRVEGEDNPLRPSLEHPFRVRRGNANDAWIGAGKMRAGDLVQITDGNWRKVTAIKPVEGRQIVYNFTVSDDHDYFVGGQGVLVHNAGPCGLNDINISEARFDHVLDGHLAGGSDVGPNSSIFSGDAQDVANLIQNSQTTDGVYQASGNIAFVNYAPEPIGYLNPSGQFTNVYTVVVNQAGDLITAFPGFPLQW